MDIDVLGAKFERDHKSENWRIKPPYPAVVFQNLDGKGTQWAVQNLPHGGDNAITAGATILITMRVTGSSCSVIAAQGFSICPHMAGWFQRAYRHEIVNHLAGIADCTVVA